jgi:O-antigen ligase
LNNRSTLFDLRAVLQPVGALLSFEAVFILFLISVNYKADPWFSWFPIDSTVVFFVLGVIMGLAIVWREGIYLPGLTVVSVLMVFIVWVMLTDLWTPSVIYAHEKILKLATLNLWSVIAAAMIVANRPERVRRLLALILVLGTAAAIYAIARYSGFARYDPGLDALSVNEVFSASFRLENNLGQARFYGMGAVVAFAAWLQTSPFGKRGIALMAAFAICCYGLLISGGRGPTLSTLLAMMLPLALGLRFADRRLLASKALIASLALLVVLIVALWQGAQDYAENLRTLQRLNTLFTQEEGGASAAGRLRFWRSFGHFWLEQPVFGNGVGSWPVLYFGLDIGRYPHNLIVEVLVEFGLLGLLLLGAVGFAAASRISVRRLREDPVLMCVAMLCIVTFLAAMTSSDITGNRTVFAMFGLLVMRPYSRRSPVGAANRARDLDRSGQPRSNLPQGVPSPRGSRL